jgi:hypothetical protein
MGMIRKLEFDHCPPKANIAAHLIVRNSFDTTFSYNWVNKPLSYLFQTLVDDATDIPS